MQFRDAAQNVSGERQWLPHLGGLAASLAGRSNWSWTRDWDDVLSEPRSTSYRQVAFSLGLVSRNQFGELDGHVNVAAGVGADDVEALEVLVELREAQSTPSSWARDRANNVRR